MVVCAMQRYPTEQQSDCNTMKAAQTTQINDAGIVDNGNGREEDDDREEGEIVDEFEMIISSEDEEFKLRARIQQLEDKSKDIEKMEMLSANLANQYNYQRPHRIGRYTQYQHFSPISVLSDVSSQSEEEFAPAKKHRKHKAKRMESRKHSPQFRRNPFANRQQRQELTSGATTTTRKKRRHERQQQVSIQLDSLDSVTEDEIAEYDASVENDIENDYDELEQLKLSRDELRMALARTANYDIRPKHSLKERLQYRLRKSPSPHLKEKEDFSSHSHNVNPMVEEQRQSTEDDEPPELKLRIIALKSAILKKHMARKKRDAERAYSPTDMINRVHQPTISNECEDIDDLMEISPAASPERPAYSPPRAVFGEPVDMDLAQTDSDEDRQHWPHNWQSTMNNCDDGWRCFMPNSLPPVSMPIIIDDDDEEERYRTRKNNVYNHYDDDVPPPPPPYHIPHMQLEDDDARDAMHLVDPHSQRDSPLTDIQSISMDNSQTQTLNSPRPIAPAESSDDEAGALRAMLLSKLKRESSAPAEASKVPTVSAIQRESETHDSDDPDELRLLLLSSIATKKKSSCVEEVPEESSEILKKAVLRFQVTGLQTTELQDEPEEPPSIPYESLPSAMPQTVPIPEFTPPTSLPPPSAAPLPVPAPQPLEETNEDAATSKPTTDTSYPTATDIIKIVKPNKVINKKTAPKRKTTKLLQPAPPQKRPTTLLVKEPVAPLHTPNGSSSTRLITTVDPATIKVNKLIITLAESSAGSDDELELRRCYAYSSYTTNYAEQPSPLSQAMDSASNSTTRSNTPNSEILESSASNINSDLRRTVINEYFEKKLDDFLKQARSKVPTALPLTEAVKSTDEKVPEKLPTKPVPKAAPVPQQSNKAKPTPVAVRHLPVASQKEYLRLIERMQLLEKKKIVENAKGAATSAGTAAVKAKTAVAKNEVKKATPKTALAETNTNTKELPTSSKTSLKMPSKESRLKAFENSFHKIGNSMITNLEKSAHMVVEARKSKVARLRYSHRFEQLLAEMQSVKQAMKLEEAKLSRIQPEIQASNEIIISLKQKRNKLRNAAMDLGRGLQGTDYRLLDPGKAEIMRKSTQLTKEIRLYNTIGKYEDTLTLPDESTTTATKEDEAAVAEPEVPTENSTASTPTPLSRSPQEPEKELEPEASSTEQEKEEEPSTAECDAVADKEDKAEQEDQEKEETAVAQLDVDTAQEVFQVSKTPKDVPPYTVSFMRELCSSPAEAKDYLLGEYRTPLPRNYNSGLNVNATVCPFELMGRCEDVDCSYLHLTRPTN